MLQKLLTILGVLAALLLVLVSTRPDTYTVERSTKIAAAPAVVYGMIQDFHAWERWSPWAKLDPSMKTTYGGPVGVGATYSWEGNDTVGSGKMTIADLKPNEAVGVTVEFIKPMSATSRAELILRPEGDGTKVTWRMHGHNDFMSKAFSLVINTDQQTGKDFDKALALLRGAAEETTRAATEAAQVAATAQAEAEPAGSTETEAADAGTP